MGQGTWDRGRFYNYTAGQGTVLCPILALIANIIIIKKQASIKSLIHQNTPRASPRGVAKPSPRTGERSPRAACGRKSEGSFSAAVENCKDQRKPAAVFGYRKVDRGTACGG